MTLSEKDFAEMKNFRQLMIVPRDENLLIDIKIAICELDPNIIIKDFPISEMFYHPFAGYRKPAFQKMSDIGIAQLNMFIKGMVAHYRINIKRVD
jgi:hypothetical protein